MDSKTRTEILILRNTAAREREFRLQEVLAAAESGDFHLIFNQEYPDCSVDDAGPIDPSITPSSVIAIY